MTAPDEPKRDIKITAIEKGWTEYECQRCKGRFTRPAKADYPNTHRCPDESHPEQHGHWDVENIARLLHERDALRSRLEAVQRAAENLELAVAYVVVLDPYVGANEASEYDYQYRDTVVDELQPALDTYRAATSAEKEGGDESHI